MYLILLTLLIFPKKSELPRFCLICAAANWFSYGYRLASVQVEHSIIINSTQIVVTNFNWKHTNTNSDIMALNFRLQHIFVGIITK